MKIKRSLKFGSFGWDDETKMFTIKYKGNSIELNKIYAFSFLRFAFSIAQRNWFRKTDKPKKEKAIICEANQPLNPITKDGEQFPLFKDMPVKPEPRRERERETCEEKLTSKYQLNKF